MTAYNVELRKNDGSAFSDLFYPKTTWAMVDGKPSTFTPTGHQHVKADITDLGSPLYSESDPVFTAWNKSTGISITKSQVSDFPASMPASDVSAWAKAASKPSYTYSEVGAAASGHNHSGVYEPVFSKNTAFNKNFGTAVDTVCQGNDSRLSNAREPVTHLADDDTYGIGDSDYYGHCRVLNILTRSTYYDGEALSAYQGYALKTLVDGKASSTHTHGNISNAGAIGSTSGLMVKTTGSGVLTTLAAGTTLQYLRGDGTWASPSGWRSIKNWGTYLSSNNTTPVAITTTESISSDKRIGIVISASTSSLRPQQIFWINTKNATSAYANGFVLNVVGNDTYSGGIVLYQIEFYCLNGVLYMDDVYKVTITSGSPAGGTCVSTTDIKVWDVLVSDH